jgi:methionine synthase II (cobalamin-independent)
MQGLPPFATTAIGSFPHQACASLCERLAELDVPAWPQLTRRSFRENMYVQYSAPLPALVVDDAAEKIHFNTDGDLAISLTPFYESYLAEDMEAFALPQENAQGFYEMLDVLKKTTGEWAKGQVTGPISFGLTVTDQDLRASLYNELLADAIVKNSAMNARWQIRRLKEVRPNIILFVDEPYMASFGSAFISLSREAVVQMLDEVFDAIHAEGALAGVHCCANTDWSVLLKTQVDILNLDAYGYLDNLALYPQELTEFLARGGRIAWGSIPNQEAIWNATPAALAERLRTGIQALTARASAKDFLISEALLSDGLLTPSCGLGSTDADLAERVLEILKETAHNLRG